MNTFTLLTGLALSGVALLTLASCNSTAQTAADIPAADGASRAYHKARNIPAHGVALDGYCPVAYFAVNRPVRGVPEHQSNHDGVTYYFVSAEAKAAFDKEPSKYVPAYGGWCAFGMSIEDKFPVDPKNFAIVDGRLMLFLKNAGVDALELWRKGVESSNVAKADAHWRRVQG